VRNGKRVPRVGEDFDGDETSKKRRRSDDGEKAIHAPTGKYTNALHKIETVGSGVESQHAYTGTERKAIGERGGQTITTH